MKALVLANPNPAEKKPLQWVELEDPVPGEAQVRIAIRACGVCHTDLHTVEGDLDLPELPIVPGHQIVGIVEEAGPKADRFAIGQRIGVAWMFHTCGECEFCRQGLENLCSRAQFTGLHANGGYAEKCVVHEDFAYPIPESFSDAHAAPLLCAGIIGYRALTLSGAKAGERLGMYGFGGSAHLTIQVARDRGCEVYVFTRSRAHKELAHRLGAVWTGSASDDPGVRMHGSIIFAPAGALVPPALRMLERGGALALAGVTMSPIPEMGYDQHLYWEKSVRSVANFTRQDAAELLELAQRIPIRTTIQPFALRDANEALLALKQSRINGTGVLMAEG